MTALNPNLHIGTILRVSGWLLLIEAGMLLAPLLMSLFNSDGASSGFAYAAGGCLLLGAALTIAFRRSSTRITRRDAFLLTSSIWILFSFVGMVPFMLAPLPLSCSAAFFETMSGFTTTGASMFSNVEAQPGSILLWRSEIQWVGGLGIVLFILAMLPMLNQEGGISMFNTEITGVTHDKLHPRIRQTAASLWQLYAAMTILLMILLWAGPMDFFDALCHAFTTTSTGGFSTSNDSIAGFHSEYTAWVLSVFMLLSGVNFILLYNALHGQWRALFRNNVLRAYAAIVGAFWLLIVLSRLIQNDIHSFSQATLEPLFTIASAITSTGFGYAPWQQWGSPTLMLVCLMMFSGACAGSTTGALKIDRIVALGKNLGNQTTLTLWPNHIVGIDLNGRILPGNAIRRIFAFLTLYLLLAAAGTILLAFWGISLGDAAFAALSCLGNNGLGFGLTASDFSAIPDPCKWMLSALMLVGRLELFGVLVILTPSFWRK